MIPQQKILRVMKLVSLLKGKSRKTPQELAHILETSDKSIYRYLKLLEEVGFVIDKDMTNRYFIQVWDEQNEDLSFNADESKLMKSMLASLKNHPLKNSIIKKIYVKSDVTGIADNIYKAGLSKLITQLTEAMQRQKQVTLKKYHSANSLKISDRIIEPFAFTDNFQYLLAYELDSKSCKHFKLERIGTVEISSKKQKFQSDHKKPKPDIFGMDDGIESSVQLSMNLRASLLLKEEYPKAEPFLSKQKDDKYILVCQVKGFRGIGRFILSNLEEITIIESKELKRFVKAKLEKGLKKLKTI
jgi:predicted DNA-binding transcriptional regulator YafY